MKKLDWYFDFISPFAYLQFTQLGKLPQNIKINYRPVLFAGLLKHFEHKGPAEIPAKRKLTYRHILWQARKNNIPFKMPPAHPFNPLKALRLSIALENDIDVISRIFDFIWVKGLSLEDQKAWEELTRELGVESPDDMIVQQAVKNELRANTEEALQLGIFGVPTTIINGELFWGFDTSDMLLDFIQDPGMFEEAEMKRVSDLPESVQRKITTSK
ncbi:MAG: 2-hydroxychromene-2-carboxylate isomerase [Candidatus Dadabacteria bacterium]|nr:2-hydroxychromene-2-carboxylate isomerase [Candidatus Dadabacteria bacterium]NIS07213.1 2-hydroxychromene-2-carboxylate isomerase [Candidatus Dadabacteria bacterium]NIV40920.1 2-hydroxychromene-2-carboxylate isomerase [Candidatus Dadabacteria bacterium]NIX14352.1 2-hydroxychromene-2-carboxylate isomerase [Candidatus Dadabacteria bacterium]NIY20870.1 2-hydroxychromene-2-carboxylate isomerase [Candidatus Dadabacteria bacterium]